MKHLKKFNEALSTQDLIDGVNDICEELNDNGFYSTTPREGSKVKVYSSTWEYNILSIDINKKGTFNFSEVSDVIYRIKDFVGIDRIKSCTFWQTAYYPLGFLDAGDFLIDINKNDLKNETINDKGTLFKIIIKLKF